MTKFDYVYAYQVDGYSHAEAALTNQADTIFASWIEAANRAQAHYAKRAEREREAAQSENSHEI